MVLPPSIALDEGYDISKWKLHKGMAIGCTQVSGGPPTTQLGPPNDHCPTHHFHQRTYNLRTCPDHIKILSTSSREIVGGCVEKMMLAPPLFTFL